MCKSFFATPECELLDRRKLRTKAAARRAIFQFIEGRYNPAMRHFAHRYLSPINFERMFQGTATIRKPIAVHKAGAAPTPVSLQGLQKMVGAAGIEPATPTMST